MGLGFVEREEVEEWLPFCKTQQMPTAGGQAEGLEMKAVASGWAHWRLRWDRRALGRPGRECDPRSPVGTVLLTGPQLASTFPRPSALMSVSATQTRKYESPHPLPSTGKHAEVSLTVVQVVGLNDLL